MSNAVSSDSAGERERYEKLLSKIKEYESDPRFYKVDRWKSAVREAGGARDSLFMLVVLAGAIGSIVSLLMIGRWGFVPLLVFVCMWIVPVAAFGSSKTSQATIRKREKKATKVMGYSVSDEDSAWYEGYKAAMREKIELEMRLNDAANRDAASCVKERGKEAENQVMDSGEREAYLAQINSFHYAPNKYAGKPAKVQNRHNPTICPKCGSHDTMVLGSGKKVSVGRAVVGGAVGSMVNPVGTAVGAGVGAITGKKNRSEMVCRTCGARWYI